MNKNNLLKTIPLTLGVLTLSFLTGFCVFAWDGPTADPPDGNVVSVPPSVSLAPSAAQEDASTDISIWINKTAAGDLLKLQSGGVTKFTVGDDARVGIGTPSPGGMLGLQDVNTYIDVDVSNNLTFTDVNAGTKTLAELAAGGGGGGQMTYDAVVDAAGGGDYTTVQDAITAGKKSIFIKDGAYSIGAVLNITISGTHLYGESREGVSISMPNVHSLTINVSASDVVFENLTLHKSWNTSLVTWSGSNGSIINCSLENRYATAGSYGWPVLGGGFSGMYVENSNFSSTQGYVIWAGGSNNVFIGNTITTTGWGGELFTIGTGSRVIGNRFFANNATGNSQFGIKTGADSVVSGNILQGSSGITNSAAISAENSIITDNMIVGFYDGIWSGSAEKGAVVNNNVIRGVAHDGIKLSGSCNSGYAGIEVVGNSINDSGQDGIRSSPGCNLVISDNNISGSGRYGIRGDYDFWRSLISGNSIRENSGGGIVMDSGEFFDNSIVTNNLIYSNGGYAINAGRIYYSVFMGNVIRSNTNNQIYYPSGTLNSEIQHNVIY